MPSKLVEGGAVLATCQRAVGPEGLASSMSERCGPDDYQAYLRVGRRGLEPRTSAVTSPERCA